LFWNLNFMIFPIPRRLIFPSPTSLLCSNWSTCFYYLGSIGSCSQHFSSISIIAYFLKA
jgi:hypothetical protein